MQEVNRLRQEDAKENRRINKSRVNAQKAQIL